jgi:hypothetical protein
MCCLFLLWTGYDYHGYSKEGYTRYGYDKYGEWTVEAPAG